MTPNDPHQPGVKLDQGKIRPNLILSEFPNALLSIAAVATMGAEKYTDNGWKYVPDGISRYSDAFFRHWLAHASGEIVDEESGLLHLAHSAWNMLAILELYIREPHAHVSSISDV